MELKFETRDCRHLRRCFRTWRTQEQTQELRLSDGMPDIGTILCAWGQVVLRSKEWNGDTVSVSGGVMAWAYYIPEDGGVAQCVNTWIPFQVKWDIPESEEDGTIRLLPQLRTMDARTVSARKMMLRASVGILGEAWTETATAIRMPEEIPKGVEVLRDTYPMMLPIEAGEKAFSLDEELTLPGTCPAMESLCGFELQPQLAERRVMAGKVVFRGTASLHILYQTAEKRLASWTFEIPFSHFGELTGDIEPDAEAEILLAVTGLELEKTESGSLGLKCGLVAQYMVKNQVCIEVVTDAYGQNREVQPQWSQLTLPAILECRQERKRAELEVECDAKSVLDVRFWPDQPQVERIGEAYEGELGGVFQVMYEDEGENLRCLTRRWTQPWSIPAADACVMVDMVPGELPDGRVNDGKLRLTGIVDMTIRTEQENGIPMLTGMELGEIQKPDPMRPSVILRRAEGESLWELARACGSTMAAIRQANQLSGEPASGQLLLIPIP